MLDLMMPDVAYTIGLLQTDGTHEGSLDGKGRVSLELAVRDESVLSQIAAILPCYTSLGHRTRRTNLGENHETATLRFYDQATRRAVASLGVSVGRKTRTIQPPGRPLATADYLRGLLDGDGSVGFTRSGEPFVSIATASPAVAEFFCQVVQEVCGVTRTARSNRRDGVFNIMVRNAAAAHLAAWVWHSADVLGLERKRMAAQQVAAWIPPKRRRVATAWPGSHGPLTTTTSS
jgi:LAGLIDADG-like domain